MIKVFCKDGIDVKNYTKLAKTAFKMLKIKGRAFIELAFADETTIKQVNAKSRGVDSETDVLSFPALNEIKALNKKNYPFDFDPTLKMVGIGSIMICETVAIAQAGEYGHSIEREKAYLFLHGLLHILGYDHENGQDKKLMREAEEKILNALNITRD